MALYLLKNFQVLKSKAIGTTLGVLAKQARYGGYWNYLYKPGPHPKTNEQHNAAAKKYGMDPLDYKPYPEDNCSGDYPKLPDIGADSKDPHYPYDCPELKRNFNEPVHYKFEIIGEDRADISLKPRFSAMAQFITLFTVLTAFFVLFYYCEEHRFGRPVAAKQYPHEGPHYLFC